MGSQEDQAHDKLTDHASTVDINGPMSLNLSLVNWLDLHLVNASQYVQTFRVTCYHKPGVSNLTADALSYLQAKDRVFSQKPNLDASNTYAYCNTITMDYNSVV